MKKNFKFMLVALLAFFCYNSAMAAVAINEEFEDGNYKFIITKVPGTSTPGTVRILGLTNAANALRNTNGSEPYISNGVLEFPATANYLGMTFTVTEMAAETFKDKAYYATSVTIPASLIEIPAAAFNTLTNLATINFAEGSQVKKIGAQAFASTRITEFDFTKCVELEGLNDEVFVERSENPDENGFNPNKNSYITKVTIPTSPNFKHINGAFRNLTELTEIAGLEESWIEEIVPMAFANTKIGMTAAKPLVLPEKDLKYVDQNALKGSQVAYLEIKMGSILYLGGCNVSYEQDEDAASDNYGSYTYTYEIAEARNNLYGFDGPTKETAADWPAAKIAPLVSLTLTGTQKGKICKNAFLGCTKLAGLDLSNLYYGTKAQFETSAFEYCPLITTLYINPITNNETDGYTFEQDAFKDTPVATLTLVSVTTAKSVNTAAFGTSLKTVTIGTVDANGETFATDAFTFGAVSGATLDLATGQGEFLNSKDAKTAIIAAGAFNFANVLKYVGTPVYPVVRIGEIKSKGAVFAENAFVTPVESFVFTGAIARNGLTVGGEEATPAGVALLNEADVETSYLKTLFFAGAIETNGIGSNTFANYTELTSVTFAGLLSEDAVAAGSFTGSGKVKDGYIGTKAAPFVKYTVTGIENWAVNPFNTASFAEEDVDRIIWWSVSDETLKAEILGAIQKAIYGEKYEGKIYNTKFNVYKWVDLDMADADAIEVPHFLFFQDQSANGNNTIAWGRYDLGSFTNEKGKYYNPELEEGDPDYVAPYEATDMIIPRYQETTGAKVKVTLYGLYYDEDNFEEVSSTYLVPLRVINGTYQIPEGNTHLIIGKAEIQGTGSFEDKDVKIYFNNVQGEDFPEENPTWADWKAEWKVGTAEGTDQKFTEGNDALWTQLSEETRVYEKATADKVKTHQELYDAVLRYQGQEESATNVVTKDLWIMTDPGKYKGFRIDKNTVTKDNYTFIGEGWYYALLNNYRNPNAAARVIWLDEAQATAIFGVKEVNAEGRINDGAIYNLQGVRVSKPGKGLYIQNGKKFIVK